MKYIIFLFAVIGTFSFGFSQSYTTAIGFKGGNSAGGAFGGGGLNLKHFISGKNALEITLGGGSNHLRGQLLYEWQNNTGITEGLDWYIGLGGSVGTWSNFNDHPKYGYDRGLYLGANGVIGLDWNLEGETGIPIGMAIDLGPYIGIINSSRIGWGGAFALRYILK